MGLVCGAAEFIVSVPDVVWSGIIASCVTLLGVGVSTYFARKQFKDQLKRDADRQNLALAHDADERRTQRDMDLRKQVFLEAAEWAAAGVHAVVRCASASVPMTEAMHEYERTSSAYGKLHAVGAWRTIQASVTFSFAVTSAVATICSARVQLDASAAGLAARNQYRARLSDKRDELADALAEVSAPSDRERLNASIDQYAKLIREADSELDREGPRHAALALDVLERLCPAMKEITEHQAELLLAIREQLGFDLNAQQYLKLISTSNQRAMQAVQTMIDEQRKVLEHLSRPEP
jgi:hypothetical protein